MFVLTLLFNVNSCVSIKDNTQVLLDTGTIIYCGWLPDKMKENLCETFKEENTIDFKCFKDNNGHFMDIQTFDTQLLNGQIFYDKEVLKSKIANLQRRYPGNKVSYQRIILNQIEGELVESVGDKKYWGEFSFNGVKKTIVLNYQNDNNNNSKFKRIINSLIQCQ